MRLPDVLKSIIREYLWSFEHPCARIIKDAQMSLVMPIKWTPRCVFSFYSTIVEYYQNTNMWVNHC